ncbi:MAG: response regulator, partial [Cyanobacteria bacterium J06606_4]
MFKIFIVEDQQLIRQGLVALLSLEEGITVIGEAENGQIALNHLEKLSPKERPNVVLMDIR